MSDPVVDKIATHLARVASGDVPEAAYAAAKLFIADALGVGIAGAGAPWRNEVLDMASRSGGASPARADPVPSSVPSNKVPYRAIIRIPATVGPASRRSTVQ